jgi:uncharacterized protein YdhG (YjbR/CyaY superfamily)
VRRGPAIESKEKTLTAPSQDVDEFLAALPEKDRDVLQSLRATIRAAAPDAVERIGYGVPAFYYKERPLVSYGAGKNHCSFYVQSPAVMEAHREALQGHDTAKGTVRFKADQPLPAALVEMLVRARLEETDAAG